MSADAKRKLVAAAAVEKRKIVRHRPMGEDIAKKEAYSWRLEPIASEPLRTGDEKR
jgi:hypothetical protein